MIYLKFKVLISFYYSVLFFLVFRTNLLLKIYTAKLVLTTRKENWSTLFECFIESLILPLKPQS